MQPLQIHPDTAMLIKEVRLLRDQLARLLQEREDLTSTIIPNLEALYYVTVGKHQYDVFCLECEVRRLKRKTEMIQAAFNRLEPINLEEIDNKLEEEMIAWTTLIDEMAHKLELARQWVSGEKLSAKEQKELQKLYYKLAKKVHPDLNPEQSEHLTSIWLQMTTAYQCGNLEGLKTLALLLEDVPADTAQLKTDTLESQSTRLKNQLEQQVHILASLKQSFPYAIKEQLNDMAWVDAQVAEIKGKQVIYEQQKSELLCMLAGLITGLKHDEQSYHH